MKISRAQTTVSFQGAFVDFRDGILLNHVSREEFRPQSSAPRFPFWRHGSPEEEDTRLARSRTKCRSFISFYYYFTPSARQTTTGLADSPTLSGYVSFIFTTERTCGSRLVVRRRFNKHICLRLREWHAGSPLQLSLNIFIPCPVCKCTQVVCAGWLLRMLQFCYCAAVVRLANY